MNEFRRSSGERKGSIIAYLMKDIENPSFMGLQRRNKIFYCNVMGVMVGVFLVQYLKGISVC